MARTKKYQPTEFMLPTSHYDKERADHAVNFIQSLRHTKGVWAGQPFLLFDCSAFPAVPASVGFAERFSVFFIR
mgnify:CR=1 FL=1